MNWQRRDSIRITRSSNSSIFFSMARILTASFQFTFYHFLPHQQQGHGNGVVEFVLGTQRKSGIEHVAMLRSSCTVLYTPHEDGGRASHKLTVREDQTHASETHRPRISARYGIQCGPHHTPSRLSRSDTTTCARDDGSNSCVTGASFSFLARVTLASSLSFNDCDTHNRSSGCALTASLNDL